MSEVVSHGQGVEIFISVRFSEAMPEAQELRDALQARGRRVFLCAVREGNDIMDAIAHALDSCGLVVIMGTKTYGKETASPFSTQQELQFVLHEPKPFFLIKMCERFEHPTTRMALPGNIAFFRWHPGTPMPVDLPDRVIARLAMVNAGCGSLRNTTAGPTVTADAGHGLAGETGISQPSAPPLDPTASARTGQGSLDSHHAQAVFPHDQDMAGHDHLDSSGTSSAGTHSWVLSMVSSHTSPKLVLANMALGDEVAGLVCNALRGNRAVHDLDLSDNNITDTGASHVADLISCNSQVLHRISLAFNQLSCHGAEELCHGLASNDCLKELDLSWNRVEGSGAKLLAEALGDRCALETVDLSFNAIDDEGTTAIAQLLTNGSKLRILRLAGNKVTCVGAKTLAECLLENDSLEELSLVDNSIGNAGAVAFATVLECSSVPWHLNLSNNRIGDDGGSALARSLLKNTGLHFLGLRWNSLSEHVKKLVQDRAAHNIDVQV